MASKIVDCRQMDSFMHCSNCERSGHNANQCKVPILSVGILAYRYESDQLKFLMIRRRNTLGIMDFMRGKYSIYSKAYILNLLEEMTVDEQNQLLECDFDSIWCSVWNRVKIADHYKSEESMSRDKFNALKCGVISRHESYNLESLIQEARAKSQWTEPEWGFPKGRKNFNEKDLDCALREFTEETGCPPRFLKPVENLLPFEEVFMGSNYKTYKHRYYLMHMPCLPVDFAAKFDSNEVSRIEWKTYEDCIQCIRPYNLEKLRMMGKVRNCFANYRIVNG